MSKTVALSALGVVGTGAAVTTVYMTGGFGGGSAAPKEAVINASISEDLTGFKDSDGGYCVQHLFSGLKKEAMKGATEISSDVADWDANKKSETSGCLVVNWDKNKYGTDVNEKWKDGKFRLLWAAKQSDTKGFIVFTSAKTSTDSSTQLTWEGIAYSLTKTNEKDANWTIVKKDANGASKTMQQSDLTNKFPKAADAFYKSKPSWEFMGNQFDMSKFCGSGTSDCTGDATPASFKGYWSWQGSDDSQKTQGLGGWTDNLTESNNWWKEIFGDDNWNMKNVVNGITGQWMQKV